MNIGFATIGESPRDDVVPFLRERLGSGVQAIEGGVLNGLDDTTIASLDDDGPGVHMVTRLRDGRKVRLAYDRVLPRMQRVVDSLVEDGAEAIVILCGADWSPITSTVPVVNPGKLFPNVLQALASGKRLGVVKPDAGQVQRTVEQFRSLGVDAVVTSASPYGTDRMEQANAAGQLLATAGVDLVWMTCVGMDDAMKQRVVAETRKKAILARSLIAGVVQTLLD